MGSVQLPTNIDYSKYMSTSGMSTRHWGSWAWKFLFTSIMGHYPNRIINVNPDHIKTRNCFKAMLTSLSCIMPCIFCRESFKGFVAELPIDDYLIGRIELMYWLYLMKDKVNKKLVSQENKCYNDEKKRLKRMFYTKQITDTEYYKRVSAFKDDTYLTAETPSFKEVLDTYESLRAVCSEKAKTCAIPKHQTN